MRISKVEQLNIEEIAVLVSRSQEEGFRFLKRLVDDWTDGSNRFSRANEALYLVYDKEQIIGIGGINNCPYSIGQNVGRIRRMYIHPEHRRKGIGERLVNTVIKENGSAYDRLTLRTPNAAAAAFYESIGFQKVSDSATDTHEFVLGL